jgi:hypothetical protein
MSKENWNDKEFVLKRVKKVSRDLEFASDRLKDNEEVVLAAVQENGRALLYASDRLKDNEEVVLASVNQNGYALKYASARLKDNEEVVLSIVQEYGFVLGWASDRLRSDVNFCIECAKKNPGSIAYFLGEAKEIFETHQHDIVAVEHQQQNKANEALLAKLSTKKFVNTTKVFKRKLLDV